LGFPSLLSSAAPRLSSIDWIVIALYLLGMIGVGVYYSRRNDTTEEYLLGGRRMKSWTVGLSLFATLISTITYLAYPGEMIKYGPMMFSALLAYPLIIYIVGWILVPFFTRLRVTSAYEILELRLGLGARMLASVFFLALRFLWMAMIVFTTTSVVLVPILGIDPRFTPLVAAVLGVITVIYTTIGGLRAVVLTDVIQTFILFAGAIAALVLISISLGGVGAWFPRQWDPGWAPPKFGFDPEGRVTLANAALSTLLWYVCTYGSDQLAIQRYLSTRDARSARRAMTLALGADVLVTILLAALGCALLAYFRQNPGGVPAGKTIASAADDLFTIYIVSGLPAGFSGLVIAGLLAAAMSSLSAGVNSASSVISVDFFQRLGAPKTQPASVSSLKLISLAVGMITVMLSLLFPSVRGNLLEIAGKVVNLFVVPLFILFFMAMFIPWARQFGAIAGALASASVGAAIAFGEPYGLNFGIKFLWIMPCELIVGIVVGTLLSLIPTSPTARQRLAEL
jgi:SSS family solute:Na+ symporter